MNAVTIAGAQPRTLSLPLRVAGLRLGSVEHPNQPTRYYLSGRGPLDDGERRAIEELLKGRRAAVDPECAYEGHTGGEAKLALLTTLLMGFAVGQASEAAANAKLELYEMACRDVPAWAVAQAMRAWLDRACPPSIEAKPMYQFAPSAPTVGALAREAMNSARRELQHLERVLISVDRDRALNPDPLPHTVSARPPAARALRKM